MKGPVATYALVSDFNAITRGNQVLVEWDTATELGTAGFELARQNADGQFVPLHQGLLAGQGPAGEGGHYRLLDPGALPGFPATYRLTEVETNGNRREVGQYTLTPEPASKQTQATADASALTPGVAAFTPRPPSAAETARVRARQTERVHDRERVRQGQSAVQKTQGVAAPGPRAALSVRTSGLYQIGTDALAAALDWPAGKVKGLLQAGQLRLTRQGTEIAWQTAANGQGLSFYGEAIPSIYDPQTVYVVQPGAGTRMAATQVAAKGPVGAASFPTTLVLEDNRFAATVRAKDPEEDYWFWGMFNSTQTCQDLTKSCRTQDFPLTIPAPAATGSATLRLHLRGNSALPANPDHRVQVSLNGTVIGEGAWDGLADLVLPLSFDQSLLRDGANTVRVEALTDAGVAYSYFYLNRFELTYQRRYQADQDRLIATGPAGRLLTASGFTSPAIQVYDLRDPRKPRPVSGAKVGRSGSGYQVSLVPATNATPYLLVAAGALSTPSVRPLETTGLDQGTAGAAYLLIAPKEFDAAATQPVQRLLNLRTAQGLSTRFVPLQGIYDEYGHGQKTPHAIRRFLTAARTWPTPPAYVLLAGKGTFDPKDHLGYGTDRLPVLMGLTPDAGLIAADQRFVDFDGDGLGELPIGRLPAATAAEFAGMVDKLIAHEDAAPPLARRAILLADGPDAAGNHTANSEAIAAHLLAGGFADADLRRLHLETQGAPVLREQLLAGLRGGTDLFNYYGHAGVTALDHGLLTAADATALTHPGSLPVMLGMTCLMSRFEFPQLISLGEALVLNPKGGAAAVWSSGGYSYDGTAAFLNTAFLDAALTPGDTRLGDAMQAALNQTAERASAAAAPRVYNLLGDPASINSLH